MVYWNGIYSIQWSFFQGPPYPPKFVAGRRSRGPLRSHTDSKMSHYTTCVVKLHSASL